MTARTIIKTEGRTGNIITPVSYRNSKYLKAVTAVRTINATCLVIFIFAPFMRISLNFDKFHPDQSTNYIIT